MRVDRRTRFEYVTCGRGTFESGKKKLRIQKYPDTCGRGLNVARKHRNWSILGKSKLTVSLGTGNQVYIVTRWGLRLDFDLPTRSIGRVDILTHIERNRP